MAKLDNRAARLLFGVLVLVALISFANSLAAALRAPRAEVVSAGGDPSRDPVPNASAVTGAALDEARIRQIAREEAGAALTARKAAAAPKPKAEDDGGADEAAAPAKPVVVTPPTAPPVLTPEPTPPRLSPG